MLLMFIIKYKWFSVLFIIVYLVSDNQIIKKEEKLPTSQTIFNLKFKKYFLLTFSFCSFLLLFFFLLESSMLSVRSVTGRYGRSDRFRFRQDIGSGLQTVPVCQTIVMSAGQTARPQTATWEISGCKIRFGIFSNYK